MPMQTRLTLPPSTVGPRALAAFIGFVQAATLTLVLILGYDKDLELMIREQVTDFEWRGTSVFDVLVVALLQVVLVWVQTCEDFVARYMKWLNPLALCYYIAKAAAFDAWSSYVGATFLTCTLIFGVVHSVLSSVIVGRISASQKHANISGLEHYIAADAAEIFSSINHSEEGKGGESANVDMEAAEPDGKEIENKANQKNGETNKASLGRLLSLAGPEKRILALGTVALVFSSGASMVVPALFGSLIRTISAGPSKNATTPASIQEAEARHQQQLNHITLMLLLFFALTSFFTFLRGSLFTLAGERLVARFRKRVFQALTRADIAFFDKTQSGELVTRLSSDTAAIQNAVTVNISMALRFAGQFVVGIILLFVLSPMLTGVMLASVPAVVIGSVFYGRFLRNIGRLYQKALASAGEIASEVLGNVRTVRSFAKESAEQERYGVAIDESFQHGKKRAFAYGAFAGGVGLFAQSAIALVLWYGGKLVIQGEMDPGTLVTFLLYTIYIASALGGLSGLYGNLMNAVGASERMFNILDMRPKINSAAGTGVIPFIKKASNSYVADDAKSQVEGKVSSIVSRIEFKNVSFSYPTRQDVDVLSDVSFSCESGNTVALVGQSGAGKSTIVSLIQRFYDPDSGSIKLGDYDLSVLDPVWLKARMACVAQEPVLFACSIRDNITYGVRGSCTDEMVEMAAKQANAHDFICGFKEGYDTQVGERGVQLSGGQKQRVAIARAILLDPSILLLDEATSALDAESEHLVQVALDRLMAGRTTLVVAHRLSTVRDADMVLVMDHGRIAERGTHDNLLQIEGGLYKYLVQRQLSGKTENDAE